ncbi:hypothetical protein IL306_007995 [Fusarium sp. DS 682]|nr:hypothetical protein IL306_007995 [Fusarium sp. DS 682]
MAPIPTPVNGTNVPSPTSTSRLLLNIIMPTQTSLPGNNTLAANLTGNLKAQDFPIYKGDKDSIFALSILAIILFFFLAMIFKDILNKKRTGELKEEARTCGNFLLMLICLPCMVFSKDNLKWLWVTFTNLFRSKENKRAFKIKDKNQVELLERIDSGPCIERLGGNWPPKKPIGSQANDEKSASGKTTEPLHLPQVTEVSVDPDHVDPQSRTLPSMSGLPVVFEVPEILPGFDKDDDGFTHTLVRGSGSNASRHGSVGHENALGVYNHGESSTQNAASSSTSHHHGAGLSSKSAGHHHSSASASAHHSHHHSYSHSYGHDSGSHSVDHGHTDCGGFDGGNGGD